LKPFPSWLRNIIPGSLLSNHSSAVFWNIEPDTDFFDLKIEYSDGSTTWLTRGLDFSGINEVRVTYDGSNTTWSWE
jgi:hypothetical protein